MKYRSVNSQPEKNIALIAHDNRKAALIDWCTSNGDELSRHRLYATGTTGAQITRRSDLQVSSLLSGPLGGDQQIGARISEGEIDMLIFFWDPFEPLPHDPDVKALLRIAAVWNIPVACNQSSADFLISSELMSKAYSREVPDYTAYLNARL